MANVNVRIDDQLKKDAEKVFSKLGINPTTAINMFYTQVIRTNSIPFELKADIPNNTTLAAIKEVEEMEKNPNMGKTYKDANELMKDLK